MNPPEQCDVGFESEGSARCNVAGPRLTDADGYVYFESTSAPGVMVFSKPGFVSNSLGGASVNTTHTVIGGIGLRPE